VANAQPAQPPATAPAAAGHGGRQRPDGPIAQRLEMLVQRLDLSDQQKQQAQAIIEQWKKDHQAFVQAHGEQLKAAMDQLREARQAVENLRKQSPDAEAIEKLKALLTPRQQKQLAEMQAREERFRREHGLPGLADKLKLTAEQRQSLRQVLESSRAAMRQFRQNNRAELEPAMKQLHEAIASGDQQKIQAARKALGELFENSPQFKQLDEQIKQVLTPEQWDAWQKSGASRFEFLAPPGAPDGPGGPADRDGPRGDRGGPPRPPQD
jgi:Spy/CpxP family protein refolding chaperone